MSNLSSTLENFVQNTTMSIVDKPEDVEVSVAISTKAVIIQIRVNSYDCGKIIGKLGRTVDALKIICLAIKNTKFPEDSRRILLEVLEDENSGFSYK
jgi:predicted RNA-binding protein YlqC (UPF0109 family)